MSSTGPVRPTRPKHSTATKVVIATVLVGIVFGCGLIAVSMINAPAPSATPVARLATPAATSAAAPAPTATTPPAPTLAPPTSVPQTAATPPQSAAKPEPPKPAAPTLAKMGERVESGGVAVTVNGLRRAADLGQFVKAKPGRTYAVADVTIETTGREKAPYNPLYFKVKDADGFEYTGSPFGADNSLKSGDLEQGGKVRGTIAFDVPSEAKGLVLSYQPAVIFGGYQTIRVSLE